MNAAKKKHIALSIINEAPIICPQVIFESLNTCIRKLKYDKEGSIKFINFLLSATLLQHETEEVVTAAISLFSRYSLQVYDSKIVAAALIAGCSILYSEDMQNGLVIDNRLTIVNPFI